MGFLFLILDNFLFIVGNDVSVEIVFVLICIIFRLLIDSN